MKNVNVTELRQNLPKYLAKVRKGERVRVTSRGEVIAEISPPPATAAEAEVALQRMRGSVIRFDRPFDPVFEPGEWEMER